MNLIFQINYDFYAQINSYGKGSRRYPDRVDLSWKAKEFFTIRILWLKILLIKINEYLKIILKIFNLTPCI